MTNTKRILYVPSGEPLRNSHPLIDDVREDEQLTRAEVREEEVADESDELLARNLVTADRRKHVADAIAAYETETAKSTPDPQVQLAELEKAVSFMWDVVSGEDIGAEATREANE